jgi:rhodanese-related sulfurtransferase
MASHEAARRAAAAGYTNVSVMVDGITGWREAGQRVARYAD